MIQFYLKTHILAACVSSGSVPGASDWTVEGREFKSHVELRSFSEFLSDAISLFKCFICSVAAC